MQTRLRNNKANNDVKNIQSFYLWERRVGAETVPYDHAAARLVKKEHKVKISFEAKAVPKSLAVKLKYAEKLIDSSNRQTSQAAETVPYDH